MLDGRFHIQEVLSVFAEVIHRHLIIIILINLRFLGLVARSGLWNILLKPNYLLVY